MKRSLTQKQYVVLEFIRNYFNEHRCSPLIREIQAGCHIASYKSAIDRLNALEHKKLIRRALNKHRGIRLVRQAVVHPASDPALFAEAVPVTVRSATDAGQDLATP